MKKVLNYKVYGESRARNRVIIAHGLFGSHKNWRTIAKRLANSDNQVIIVDMRNHGNSFWHNNHNYEDLAADLKMVIDEFGGKADVIGHSMGGKAAMTLALLYPKCVEKLVVVDIAPIKYNNEQHQLTYIDALQSINLNSIQTRKDLNERLSLRIDDPDLVAFFCQSFVISGSQKMWLFNLNSLKKNLSNIMNFPNLGKKSICPTLVFKGCLSNYITTETFPIFAEYFPNYRIQTIENASHWLHVEACDTFLDNLMRFLEV